MLNEMMECTEDLKLYCDVTFYSIDEVRKLLGWSEMTVQKLFNDPNFPSTDFGKRKVVESHALIRYFSVRHEKKKEKYWR